jgi:DNA-binding transcriptional ArsR family regulator
VERERLRVHFDTEDEYEKFFNSEEVDRLFHDLVVDKLTISQILLLLRERPLSTGEISEILGLSPSEVSRYLNSSAKEGLVRFDEVQKCFVPA